jgi:hypothetical protein
MEYEEILTIYEARPKAVINLIGQQTARIEPYTLHNLTLEG